MTITLFSILNLYLKIASRDSSDDEVFSDNISNYSCLSVLDYEMDLLSDSNVVAHIRRVQVLPFSYTNSKSDGEVDKDKTGRKQTVYLQ